MFYMIKQKNIAQNQTFAQFGIGAKIYNHIHGYFL